MIKTEKVKPKPKPPEPEIKEPEHLVTKDPFGRIVKIELNVIKQVANHI